MKMIKTFILLSLILPFSILIAQEPDKNSGIALFTTDIQKPIVDLHFGIVEENGFLYPSIVLYDYLVTKFTDLFCEPGMNCPNLFRRSKTDLSPCEKLHYSTELKPFYEKRIGDLGFSFVVSKVSDENIGYIIFESEAISYKCAKVYKVDTIFGSRFEIVDYYEDGCYLHSKTSIVGQGQFLQSVYLEIKGQDLEF